MPRRRDNPLAEPLLWGAVSLSVIAAVAFVVMRARAPLREPVAPAPRDEVEDEWSTFLGVERRAPPTAPRADASREPEVLRPAAGTGLEVPSHSTPFSRDDAERTARRAAWMKRRTEIVPLGESPPGLEPADVFAALEPVRPLLRACVREGGGFRAMRNEAEGGAGRGAGAGGGGAASSSERVPRRRRGAIGFDVGADGAIVAGSLELEPAMPPTVRECFVKALSTTRFSRVGADGARVSVALGGGRRAGMRLGGSPDAGVVSGRLGGVGVDRRRRGGADPDRAGGEDRGSAPTTSDEPAGGGRQGRRPGPAEPTVPGEPVTPTTR